MTPAQRVLELLAQQGLLRPRDLQTAGIARVVLQRMLAAGQLERAGRGVYCLPGSEYASLGTLALRVPQAVLCLLSALHWHGLIAQAPAQTWIMLPQGSHCPRLDSPPLKMVQASAEVYNAGIEVVVRDRVPVRVYNVAKTVADCFKHRSKIGMDVAVQALKTALSQNQTTVDALHEYASLCRVTEVMRPYLELAD